MGFFEPDDFAGRPYDGGNNQALHVVFGQALVAIFSTWFLPWVAMLIAGGGVILWELDQLRRRGATRKDYLADLFYWLLGLASWTHLLDMGWVTGPAIYGPLLILAAWCLEFARLSWADLFHK